ncbi:MAG: Ig-like domain-containing protein [Tenuifilaceae bacterium]|jgi:hypothetical protein|nr:Ig-like domain-containing protein [Tenuifilaceae bacterium]
MRKPLRKLATILIALTLLVWSNLGWGQYSGSGTFEQITTLEEIESGTYYVLYGINGSYTGAMTNTISGGRMGNTSVSLTENTIVNPSTSIVWLITGNSTDGFTVYNEAEGKYCEIIVNSTSGFAFNVESTHTYALSVNETGAFSFASNHADGGGRKISIYQNDWRPYASANTLNLYKIGADESAPVPTFTPYDGTTDVLVTVNPTITFDEVIYTTAGVLVDDANVESLITFTSAAKASVPFAATIADRVITIVPDAVLTNEMEYTVTIQPVQDAAENVMGAEESATFTTIAATAQAIELTGDYSAPYYAGDDVTVTWTSTNIDNVKVEAWVPSMGDWQVMVASEPAANGTATFTIPATALFSPDYKIRVSDATDGEPASESAPIKVRAVAADLATARTYVVNDEFRYDGEALVTAINSYNNQKYIQDASAAILIYDATPAITTSYTVGDKMTALVGKIAVSNNMVRLVPLADPGAPVSSGNAVEAAIMTIPDVTADEQAKFIKLENLTFETPGTFENGKNYTMTDGTNTIVLRTEIYNTDYIGTTMPTSTFSVSGVVLQYSTTMQLVARNAADFEVISNDATLSTFTLGGQSVLELTGLVVADPAADAGATLNVEDFTSFAGIDVVPTDANATLEVKLNGAVVEAANLATQALADGDIVVVKVTAEDETTIIQYKVTLTSENRQLTLTAPAGGENLNTGDDIVFTWTSANITNVNLYAVDTEEAYLINESPIDATLGTYTHTIENGVFGSYTIRIADAADVAFYDETATAITITDDDAPNAVEFTPANGATGVALSFTLSAEFDEDIKLGTGNLTIHKASDNSVVVTVPAANITVDYDGATAEITGLDWETAYYVNVEAGLLLDMSDNPVGAITTATDWAFTTRQEPGSDLFFSEYIEGDGNNRAFEIFNPTAETIDLSHYVIKQSYNGAGWGIRDGVEMTEYILPLTGTLESKAVYVIYNADAGTDISNVGDLSLAYGTGCDGCRMVSFTGNDALGLFKDGELIDQIGDPSSNTNFDVAGVTGASVDHTLVRKSSVVKGNINWAVSAGTNTEDSEWIVFDKDTYEHLGSHDFASSVRPVWGTSIAAFPNPFTHTLYIDNAENATRVVVINLIGQQVMSVNLNGDNRVPIATENLAKGIYLISIENNKGERTVRKMIKR